MNRRHRAVDILGGAAIGILATELGYLVTDRIFGSRQIQRLDASFYDPERNPSFIDIQMGAGLHSSSLRFTPAATSLPASSTDTVSIGASAAVAVEGAYFINRYVGFGGMIRLTSTPVSPLHLTTDERTQLAEANATLEQYTYRNPANGTKYPLGGVYSMYVNKGQLTETSVDAGVYASLPLSSRLSIGAKALAGVRLSGSATFTSRNGQLIYDGGETTDEGKKKSYYLFYRDEYIGNSRCGSVAVYNCAEVERLAEVTQKLAETATNFYDPTLLQTYEGQTPHQFYDFGQWANRVAQDNAALAAFNSQFENTVIAKFSLPTFYSAYGSYGTYDIDLDVYSGVTTSAPSSAYPQAWYKTNWYKYVWQK
jgi:hypothetical protein